MKMPSKETLRAFADAVSKATEDIWLTDETDIKYEAAEFLYDLAREQEEPPATKIIVIDPGRRHTPQCPFWTGAGAERHCGICPPDIELGQCFGAIPDWCPLPVLVRLKTDDEDIAQGVQPDEPKQPKPCPFCGYDGVKINVTIVPPTAYWGECKSCHTLGPKRAAESEASAAWNRRAEDARRKQPKVESLREAALRYVQRRRSCCAQDIADTCAVVLRRHLALLKLFTVHVSGDLTGRTGRQADLEVAEIDQMLEGSE